MIGTNIRGIRHLWRVSDCSLRKVLVRCGEHGFDICEVIKTKPDSKIGERMYIFNSYYNQTNYCISTLSSLSTEMHDMLSEVTHSRTLEVAKSCDGFRGYDGLFSEITLLPNSFDKDYASFLKENNKMVKNLTEKYCVNTNDIRVKRIYIYTDGSKYFFQWAMDLYFKAGCSMRTILNILTWNEHYKQLTKKLSKGTITAYTSQESVNDLMEELAILRNDKRVNDAINLFNTAQKKLLKANEQSKTDKNTLARFSKLSDTKKNNFIRKVSTIDDYQELMRQMRHVTSVHFDWSKESFMDFIKNVDGINYEVVYENDFVVLVKVADYETIKQLGKTTNWCISKNKSYWNSYIEHNHGKATQYMIFDFSKLEDDKLSIVGFTTTYNKGITSAHNFINDNLMNDGNNMNALMLKSYLARFDNSNSIYKVLQNCGIDITLVAHYDKPQYKWSYEDLMSYLYECVDKNNVDIIKYDGDRLVLSVRDENIKYFLGDAYMDNISSDDYEEQHIIFADFTMSQYDPNKLIFGIIYSGGGSEEDYCSYMYNESSMNINVNFDSKLIEFGVPYDIIKRTDDINKKVRNAFTSFNVNMLMDCIKKEKNCLHKAMSEYFEQETIYYTICQSVIDFLSFDYLNIIYDNGHYLNDYIDSGYIAEILKNSFNNLKAASRQLYRNSVMEKPNEERIEAFYNETLKNRNDVLYVGNYLIIKEIIKRENKEGTDFNRIYCKILSNIYNSRLTGALIKELMYLMLDNINMSEKMDSTNYIASYFARFGDEEMQDTIKGLAEKHSWITPLYESVVKDKKKQEAFVTAHVTVNNGRGGVYTIDLEEPPF